MYLQDEIQNLKNKIISGNYKNEELLFILKEINDVLIYGQISIDDEKYFIEKYREIIDYIDKNNLYVDSFDYLEYKAYFYYLNGKTQRLLTLINSYKLFKNNDLLILLIQLLVKDNFDKNDVFEYVNIILDNGIESIYIYRKLKSLLIGKYEFDLSRLEKEEIKSYMIESNNYLIQHIKAFYHSSYVGFGNKGNPDYINILKNTYNNTSKLKLNNAVKELESMLLLDIPQILQKINLQNITICVVPRAKSENTYTFNQLLFKSTISDSIKKLNNCFDGTNYIIRKSNTRTTHLPLNTPNYNNDGNNPYPGITKETCNISSEIKNKDILLIDDVYTKGINIDEDCIQALIDNGAKTVIFYSIGKTNFN